jgi:hypothetical protein
MFSCATDWGEEFTKRLAVSIELEINLRFRPVEEVQHNVDQTTGSIHPKNPLFVNSPLSDGFSDTVPSERRRPLSPRRYIQDVNIQQDLPQGPRKRGRPPKKPAQKSSCSASRSIAKPASSNRRLRLMHDGRQDRLPSTSTRSYVIPGSGKAPKVWNGRPGL